jgi:hypothetical protein
VIRRLSLLLLVLVLAAPATAEALSRRLLVDGDSLAVGTAPYLPRELGRWKVIQSTSVSRHAYEGAGVMRAFGRRLPRVIHVSLGTNDDPRSVDAFRSAIGDVMAVAGARRCVVWANIVRPAVAGASYAGYNRVLAQGRSRERTCAWSTGPAWFGRTRIGSRATACTYRPRATRCAPGRSPAPFAAAAELS